MHWYWRIASHVRLCWLAICPTQAFRHKYYYLMMQIMSKWCKGKFSIEKKEDHRFCKTRRKEIKNIIKSIVQNNITNFPVGLTMEWKCSQPHNFVFQKTSIATKAGDGSSPGQVKNQYLASFLFNWDGKTWFTTYIYIHQDAMHDVFTMSLNPL